jgi:hypothetical protein
MRKSNATACMVLSTPRTNTCRVQNFCPVRACRFSNPNLLHAYVPVSKFQVVHAYALCACRTPCKIESSKLQGKDKMQLASMSMCA